MATISSPRLPPQSPPTSSARSSLSIDRSSRRTRTALRDYYNLKPTTPSSPSHATLPTPLEAVPPERTSEFDASDFIPQTYVSSLLSTAPLPALLRAESTLLSEIRSLDGERKALVYDNYAKLIAATDAMARMRRDMEPLGSVVAGLGERVGRIAEVAGGLVGGFARGGDVGEEVEKEKRRREVQIVRWVLDAPGRIEDLVGEGRREEAVLEWAEVCAVLDKWDGVGGVEEVRRKGDEVFGHENGAENDK